MTCQDTPDPRAPGLEAGARYTTMFTALAARSEGAFVPFTVLGDPSPEATIDVLEALVAGGADALELGIPFSDPIADGPVIQAADLRALEAGTTPDVCFRLLESFRRGHPEIPLGLLVYANLVSSPGLDRFYRRAASAGVDSVLVADVPSLEAAPWCEAALGAGVAPVLLVPPAATAQRIQTIARLCRGYCYVLSRSGITGAREALTFHHRPLLEALRAAGAPPALFGFGISTPAQVRQALETGAAGAISGSAVVALLAQVGTTSSGLSHVADFVKSLKAATRGPWPQAPDSPGNP